MAIEVVCFDMDGTLIRNTDSVRYLCTLNDRLEEFDRIECREADGSVSWIEADYLKAELVKGLDLTKVESELGRHIRFIQNIDQVLLYLKEKHIVSALLTAGPTQVANLVGAQFGFDRIYGSQYEVQDRKFTGRISAHVGNKGKLDFLKNLCAKNSISLDHCVPIGDSESDIALFKECGRSIAVNCSDAVKGEATEYIITEDLADVLPVLESWLTV